jgi:hypothetical protein
MKFYVGYQNVKTTIAKTKSPLKGHVCQALEKVQEQALQ